MIRNVRLRFDTEAEAIAALPQYRTDGIWIAASHDHALDPIGPLGLDGRFHVNLRTDDTALVEALESYRVRPADRLRVWF